MKKFKIGSSVITKGGEEAVIVDCAEKCKHYDIFSYRVKFLRTDLIPSEMWYPYYWIYENAKPSDSFCPICKTDWTVTTLGKNVWKDCKPCGKKAEDILNDLPPPTPTDTEEDYESW